MPELPITSEVGLGIVVAYLVIKEFLGVIKKGHREVTIHPDSDIKEAVSELAKLLAVQTEILRGISETQKDLYRRIMEKPLCRNFESA